MIISKLEFSKLMNHKVGSLVKVTSSDFKLATFFPISPFFFGGISLLKGIDPNIYSK